MSVICLAWCGLACAKSAVNQRNRGIAQRDHRCRTVAQDHFDARVPDLRRADFGRGVAHHQALQALAGVDPQPLADQAAHGQAAEMRADIQRIEQREHIVAQLLDAVGPSVTSDSPWPRVS
jgi:transposase